MAAAMKLRSGARLCTFSLLLLASPPLVAQSLVIDRHEPLAGTGVAVDTYKNNDSTIFEIRVSNSESVAYHIDLTFELENMSSSVPTPLRADVPALSTELVLVRFQRSNASRPYAFRELYWFVHPGPLPPPGGVQNSAVYELPWARGASFDVANAFHGTGAHQGLLAYAVDFTMPPGTPIHAARGGRVIAVVDRFTRGGPDPALPANYVAILHDDGSVARYLHLRRGGAVARIHAMVRVGELLGYSGNTGWSLGPHLHFDVIAYDDEQGMRSLPFQFRGADGQSFEPVAGMRLRRGPEGAEIEE